MGERCCVVGCKEPVAVWVLIRIFDMTVLRQMGKRPFCERHRPDHSDGTITDSVKEADAP